MTTQDSLVCIGGPFHGEQRSIAKTEDRLRFPRRRRPFQQLQSRDLDGKRRPATYDYRRLKVSTGSPRGRDLAGHYFILAYSDLSDDDAVTAYVRWRRDNRMPI